MIVYFWRVQQHAAGGDFVEVVDKRDAPGLEAIDDVLVMHDLVVDVEWSPMQL
jgi:hypothetical protein